MLALAADVSELLEDYENGNSREARVVKQWDKLDMGLQAEV